MSDRNPLDETGSFSVGVLTQRLGLVEVDDLEAALEAQRASRPNSRIGELLLERGLLTLGQLAHVLALQERLKSPRRSIRAMAAADLAEAVRTKVVGLAESVEARASETRRESGSGYPAVARKKGGAL